LLSAVGLKRVIVGGKVSQVEKNKKFEVDFLGRLDILFQDKAQRRS